MLGEMEIILNIDKRKYCFMTKKGAELLTLSKREFKKLMLVDYREIGKQIMNQAEKKMKVMKSDYKKAIAHLKKSRDKMDLTKELVGAENNENDKNDKVYIFTKFLCMKIFENYEC